MARFLIRLRSKRHPEKKGAAVVVNLDLPREVITERVKALGGDPACEHCRNIALRHEITDAVHEVGGIEEGVFELGEIGTPPGHA